MRDLLLVKRKDKRAEIEIRREQFSLKDICTSHLTVKMRLKSGDFFVNWQYFKNNDYLCGHNMRIPRKNNHK